VKDHRTSRDTPKRDIPPSRPPSTAITPLASLSKQRPQNTAPNYQNPTDISPRKTNPEQAPNRNYRVEVLVPCPADAMLDSSIRRRRQDLLQLRLSFTPKADKSRILLNNKSRGDTHPSHRPKIVTQRIAAPGRMHQESTLHSSRPFSLRARYTSCPHLSAGARLITAQINPFIYLTVSLPAPGKTEVESTGEKGHNTVEPRHLTQAPGKEEGTMILVSTLNYKHSSTQVP